MHEGAATLDPHIVREIAQPYEVMPLPRVEYDPDGDASPPGVVQRVDHDRVCEGIGYRQVDRLLGGRNESRINYVETLFRRIVNLLCRAAPVGAQGALRQAQQIARTCSGSDQLYWQHPFSPPDSRQAACIRAFCLERFPSEMNCRGFPNWPVHDFGRSPPREGGGGDGIIGRSSRAGVVEAVVVGGLSRNAAAKRFGVSIASAVRWVQRFCAKLRDFAGSDGRGSPVRPHRGASRLFARSHSPPARPYAVGDPGASDRQLRRTFLFIGDLAVLRSPRDHF